MQYFIGIPLPDGIKEKVVSFQKNFPNNKLPFIVEPHITVKAQGGLTDDMSWISRVKNIIKGYPRFDISLTGVDSFGERVIFLALKPSKELIELHNTLIETIHPSSDLLEKYYEGINYHPHLTLAETSYGMTPEELIRVKEGAKNELLNLSKFTTSLVRIYEHGDDFGAPCKTLLDVAFGS